MSGPVVHFPIRFPWVPPHVSAVLESVPFSILQLRIRCCADSVRGGIQGAIERAAPTLAAAHAISKAVSIPVMAASGLSDVTAPMALAAGARGVGVGSAGEEPSKAYIVCGAEIC